MMESHLRYRLYNENDVPGLVSLWSEHSGWGPVTETQFRQWCMLNPFEASLICLAENEENDIVGQLFFMPSRVIIKRQEVKALRLSAPILHPNYRHTDLKQAVHPVLEMFMYAAPLLTERGYKLIYTFPAHGWLALFKVLPKFRLKDMITASYDCYQISLNSHADLCYTDAVDFAITRGVGFTADYDRIWAEAVEGFPINCAIARSKEYLQYRHGDDLTVEVRAKNSGSLVGYVIIDKSSGLLKDALGRTPEDLAMVLQQVIYALHQQNPARIDSGLECIKYMNSPIMTHALKDSPVQGVNYRFAFGCYPLDETIPLSAISEEKWHLMPDL